MAIRLKIAVDVPHHTRKGALVPGDVDSGRGSTAVPGKARLIYTMTVMNKDEAELFGVDEADRRSFVRVDSAKLNIAPPARQAAWFRLVNVRLGNPTMDYPDGDAVQAIEAWPPPEVLADTAPEDIEAVMTEIHAGFVDNNGKTNYYTDYNVKTERGAWMVVQRHYPAKSQKACQEIIKDLVAKGLLYRADLKDTDGRPIKGLQRRTGPAPKGD